MRYPFPSRKQLLKRTYQRDSKPAKPSTEELLDTVKREIDEKEGKEAKQERRGE
jgi:hypothetical protein